ncbi:MAG: hypothetical protein ABI843_14820 [Dokdonella sp.]
MSFRLAVLLLSTAALAPAAIAQAHSGHPSPPRLQPVTLSGTGTCSPDGLCLAVTLALADPSNPQACGSQTSIVADVGDQISWCYTLTNNSTQTVSWQTLSDSVNGTLFSEFQQAMAPGQSLQYVNLAIAGTVIDTDVSATWSASVARPSYTFDDSVAYDFIDASDATLLDQSGGFPSGRTAAVQAPFPINFFGTVTDQLCIGANGAIEIGTTICAIPMTYAFPATYFDMAIAPAWSGYTDSVGSIYTKTLGSTPGQRQFVVEWKDMQLDFPTLPGFTFEVVMDEASGTYRFQYQSTGDGSGAFGDAGSQAVSGLQVDTTTGLQYSYFTPTLTPGKAILWTPQQPDALSTSASVHADIGAAQLALPITEMDAQAAVGIRITQPLVIGNAGNRALTWNAGEYPPAAVAPLSRRAIEAPDAVRLATIGQRHPAQAPSTYPSRLPSARSLLGELGLPAYAVQVTQGGTLQDFIRFDVFNPGQVQATVIAPDLFASNVNISGGDFVDNDFSREWMLDFFNLLYTFDTTTGAKTLVGWPVPQMIQANEQWWGTSWDPATGNFYAVSNASNGWSGLYSIDLTTAAATFIGQIDIGMQTSVVDIAVDQNGLMYGLDTVNDALLAIDKSSGAATVVGLLGIDASYAQSMKFDRSTGTLYWMSYDVSGAGAVATIDPVTGAATPAVPTGNGRELVAFAIAKAGGDCTQPLDAAWLTLETTSGTAQPGDPYGLYTVDFDATNLAAGEYDATICVFSNDPAYRTHPAAVPVHFNVAPGDNDAIFSDGFDG